jgi:hypothetical protein
MGKLALCMSPSIYALFLLLEKKSFIYIFSFCVVYGMHVSFFFFLLGLLNLHVLFFVHTLNSVFKLNPLL